jgi:hypothetical protein
MCLDSYSLKPRRLPNYKAHVGWKVFRKLNDVLHFSNYGVNKKDRDDLKVPRGIELTSSVTRANSIEFENYPRRYVPYFHIYLTKPNKPNKPPLEGSFVIVPVKFKNPTTTGYQDHPVVVAKKMFVPKGIKKFLKENKVE